MYDQFKHLEECLEAETAVREGEGDARQRERDVVKGRRLHRIFTLLLVIRSGLFIIGFVHVVSLWRGKFILGPIFK